MRIPGYCTGCRRIKQVRLSSAALVNFTARGATPHGICADCEQKETHR